MALMYDSTNPFDIPTTAQVVAGYVDGIFAWDNNGWERFTRAIKVGIAVSATTVVGVDVLDVETGNATPDEAVQWVTMLRARGKVPIIYCSQSTWPAVQERFVNVAQPLYWIAHYDGDPTIPVGACAKQFIDPPGSGGHWDLSEVNSDFLNAVTVGGIMTMPDTTNALAAYGRVDALTHMRTAVDFNASPVNGESVELVKTLMAIQSQLTAIQTQLSNLGNLKFSGSFSLTGSGTVS